MKDLKQIEEEAIKYKEAHPEFDGCGLAFFDGAISESDKAYHTQGMYSLDQIRGAYLLGRSESLQSKATKKYIDTLNKFLNINP